MPIAKENKHRYPKNWATVVRPNILKRADNRCELCGVRNYSVIARDDKKNIIRPSGNIVLDNAGHGLDEHGNYLTYSEASIIRDFLNHDDWCEYDFSFIVVVLTIMHLNHIPEDCRDENLKAGCQRCHLVYDIEHHLQNRKRNKNQMRLL